MNTKNIIVSFLILVLIGFGVALIMHSKPVKDYDQKKYELKIDSLQKNIDSVFKKNDSLESKIQYFENKDSIKQLYVYKLENTIKKNKSDSNYIQTTQKYTETEVDSFFKSQYKNYYSQKSKDTTKIPIIVSRQIAIDIQTKDKDEFLIKNYDSLVANLNSILVIKDTIITDLKYKEKNYLYTISQDNQQKTDYKIIVNGLNTEIKQKNRALRWAKIKTIIVAGVLGGIIVLHK